MSRIALPALVALAVAVGAYAYWIEPVWVEVTQHDLRRDKALEPIRIAQLSDLHLQAIGRTGVSVAASNQQIRPDVIILSGDVIDQSGALPLLAEFLESLGDVPVVAVLGNWEHWSGVDLTALSATYGRRPRTHLLVNQTITLSIRGRPLHITGLDDFTAGRPYLATSATPGASGVSVLVQHSPGFFSQPADPLSARRFDVCMAGHTHGGQITLFGSPLWTPRGSGPYGSGFYNTEACRLFVSRGIGTSVLPVRLGARPEIAVFDL